MAEDQETLFPLPAPDPDPVLAAEPCGELVDTAFGPWGLATATFSRDRIYRYRLSRVWDPSLPRVNFLMLNPSTADAFKLDPTVRRCMGFAKSWGAGSVEVTNCFAFRSKDPEDLRCIDDPVGRGNDQAIASAARAADYTVAAWGVHATWQDREQDVLAVLTQAGVTPLVLRFTKDGHPGHPLYVPADAELTSWPLQQH